MNASFVGLSWNWVAGRRTHWMWAAALGLSWLAYGVTAQPLWAAVSALSVLTLWPEPSDALLALPLPAGAVLSPADGRIVRIDKAHDPYANREALRISVFMGLFTRHSTRVSVDGVVQQVHYFPGAWLNAELDTGSPRQERNAVVIESQGQLVTLVQTAGLFARRILCHVRLGDRVTRGQRYGRIRFGSRVDVYLPAHAVPKVAPGDKVTATTTILATLAKA